MKNIRPFFPFLLIALFITGLAVKAKVPPLLEVPDYLPMNLKKDLNNERSHLEKRIASLRQWADRYNASCGNRTLSEDDPKAKDCLDQKAKLDKAGQQYSKDAIAFDDKILKATFVGAVAEVRGEVYFVTPDGRKLTVDGTSKITVNLGTRILTGPTGHLNILLNDETVFTLGPQSEFVIDDFVFDPKTSVHKVGANFLKGTFRWVTGKVAQKDTSTVKIKVAYGTIGPRGTDFEVSVAPDKSGYVKLFSGKLEITEAKSGGVFEIDAGQMFKFHADGTREQTIPLDTKEPSI